MNSLTNKYSILDTFFKFKSKSVTKRCLYHKAKDCFKSYSARKRNKRMFFDSIHSSNVEQEISLSIALLIKAFIALYCLIFKSNAATIVMSALNILIANVKTKIFCSVCCKFSLTHSLTLYLMKYFCSSNLYLNT